MTWTCPACSAPLAGTACAACGALVEVHAGIPDLAPHLALSDPAFGREQHVMNTRWFARLYETRLWRPLHGWVASRGSLGAEIDDVLDLAGDRRVTTAVDVACGTGLYTRAMANRWPDAEIAGIDISLGMLTRAHALATKSGLGRLTFVRGDIHRLPLPDASVDYVNCSAALHLFPDRRRIWREIARVLAPGGAFTAMTVGRRPPGRARLQAFLERHVSFRFFDPPELESELRADGFGDVRLVSRHAALYFCAVRA